jgi:hypothetical protein
MKSVLLLLFSFCVSAFQAQSENPFTAEQQGDSALRGTAACGFGASCGNRTRLTDPNFKMLSLVLDQKETFFMKAQIDSIGNVVSISNLASKTTCKDLEMINKVLDAVMEQVKYCKKPGAEVELVYLTIHIHDN